MTDAHIDRAIVLDFTELRCLDRRCRTLLPGDAEICDECGGTNLGPLAAFPAALSTTLEDRPVVFALEATRPAIVGRSVPGGEPPDVDLARFPGAAAVHRRHAVITLEESAWRIIHNGENPLRVEHAGVPKDVAPNGSALLRSGDRLIVGSVALYFFAVE